MPAAAARSTLRRLRQEWLMCLIVVLGFALLMQRTNMLERFDLMLYDALVRADIQPTRDDILIIAIDNASLRALGRWPWPRDVHTRLLQRLAAARPRAVAFDIIFSEPARSPASDAGLARAFSALRDVCPVFLPVSLHSPLVKGRAPEVLYPLPLIESAVTGLGHIHVEVDRDNVVRSLYMQEGIREQRWPSLSVALARASGVDVPKSGVDAPPDGTGWSRTSRMLIPFSGPPGHYRSVPYASVLSGEVPDAMLRGKTILVGLTATGLGDQHPTTVSGGSGLMPGVEIGAAALDGLLRGQLIAPVSVRVQTLVTALALLGWMTWLWRSGPQTSLLGLPVFLLASLATTTALQLGGHLWFPVSICLAGSLLGYVLWSWRRLMVLLADLYKRADAMQPAPSKPSRDGWQNVVDALDRGFQAEKQAQRQRTEALQLLSHDLRAPQSAVLALLRTQPPLTPASAMLYERIELQVQTTLWLADDFVLQLRAEGERYVCEEVDLAQLLIEVFERAWPLAKDRGIELRLSLPDNDASEDSACWLLMEPRLLGRAFFNLMENAIKYSAAGSRTELGLACTAGDAAAVVTVSDQGGGIPSSALPYLFDRYSQFGTSDTKSDAARGHGLGLRLVKTVVERHGGTVAVSSTQGHGSVFTVTLPIARA
jgi:CHASE2 domain-containing sensor protein/two-component sensor histidine kinase